MTVYDLYFMFTEWTTETKLRILSSGKSVECTARTAIDIYGNEKSACIFQ